MMLRLTFAGEMTILLYTLIWLKVAERSEAKIAKQSFASTISKILKYDAKLRFALFFSLRSFSFSRKTRSEASRQKYLDLEI